MQRVEKLISQAGLPDKIPDAFLPQEVIARLKMDKKKKDDVIHFVLIKKIGMPFVHGGIPDQIIHNVLEEMKA